MGKRQSIDIRALNSWQELEALYDVQRQIWPDNLQFAIQPPLLNTIRLNGGLVLGAFDGERLVGGAVALLGADSSDSSRPAMANLKLTSERIFVLPEYQNQGIGTHLKLAQYQFAAQRGIRLMTWYLDPLSGAYAHITMRKLGAVVSRYLPDLYPDQVVEGSGDRFQADWWLTSGRALERLKKKGRSPLSLAQYLDGGTRILNPTVLDDRALPKPSDSFIQPPSALGLIEVPARIDRIEAADAGLLRAWQEHTRAIFGAVLSQGFVLTDYVHEIFKGRPRSFYVCSHEGALRNIDRTFNRN
ncbi:MAG: hypothetical protein Kow0077_03850 [Anaerolineae bacterium]